MVAAGLVLPLALAAYAVAALSRQIPDVTVVAGQAPQAFPGRPGLPWPAQGEAAVAIQGVGVIGSHRAQQPLPIASVAKVMTALVVLRDHPLAPQGNGPEIAVSREDVAVYRADRRTGQSTAAVLEGEELSERQALEGLLLPSANNLATLLARWDAGSEDAFVERMNAEARSLGMAATHYADASGFSAATVSTASDQVRLASSALRVRALAQIVALRQVSLPVAGTLRNLDALLGFRGVVGVKTGSTAAAGGCFLFAARVWLGGRRLTVIGAVMGQPGTDEFHQLAAAFDATKSLLAGVRRQLMGLRTVVGGRRYGVLRAPWSQPVGIALGRVPELVGWPGLPLRLQIVLRRRIRAPVAAGQHVGVLIVRAGPQKARIPLLASGSLGAPALGWRLTHP